MGPMDVMAFLALMATLCTVGVAFSPLGRALAERIRGRARGPALDTGEVADLRRELDEVQNRLDFTERMLAQARDKGLLGGAKGA